MGSNMKILLTTEGTYPYYQGGVSTWCDLLVRRLPDVDYIIYSVLANPFITQKFSLPDNASVVKMPLWGTEEPAEHLNIPFSQVLRAKLRTDESVIKMHFLPIFQDLVEEVVKPRKDALHFGRILIALNDYLQVYEYKATFKSELVWKTYKSLILGFCSDSNNRIAQPDVYGMIQSIGWLYRFLNIVNTPIPKVHVTHSSAAAFCGIPCAIAKLRYGTPYLLTEHGVYLREQYLSVSKQGYSSFLSTFLIRFVQSVVGINYATADQVSPVCNYNTRWEKRFGVSPRNVKVIYNGVDDRVFSEVPSAPQANPTIAMIARIDPLKDILTFIRAFSIIRKTLPDAKAIVYGSVSVQAYYEECLALREQLNLNDSFIFAGHTSNMSAAYQSGDVVALSSISEAFPYSVVEAMMSSKAIVATDVGGVSEAIGETGIIVPPRDPQALADGLIKLLKNPELRHSLGREGRERAMNFFTLGKVLDLHLKSYIQLAARAEERVVERIKPVAADLQKLHMDRGYALLAIGQDRDAILQFRIAVKEKPISSYVPVLLTEIARAFNRLGEYDQSFQELDKCKAYIDWLQSSGQEIA
ncbi:GT4 family glycosyltransferase PelF [Paenibacillus alginolyticus]|uniref:GT4 family glycosyltransferase PelF n=1 Tax=Paenibacillus alginolyticus TaxID=59839 RepID=UPI000428B765|nr:GT4 family glycosyltransferase PelF [Paenibacillus alginolyticus]MCY9664230.1 GT4 family glycosyltransferase PelF [Paenibacillus alginolyticus]